ncbi:MAG: protein kinase [Acidobacteriota bacterium]
MSLSTQPFETDDAATKLPATIPSDLRPSWWQRLLVGLGLDKMPRFSLLTRLVLALAAVGVVPFVLSLYQINASRAAMVEQVQKTHLVAVLATADRLTDRIRALATDSESAARRLDALDASELGGETGAAILAELLRGRGDMLAAGLWRVDGDTPVMVQTARREALPEGWPRIVERADDALVAAYVGPDAEPWVEARIPFADDALAVVATSRLGNLDQLIRPEEIGDQVSMMLIGDAGQMLHGDTSAFADLGENLELLVTSEHLRSGVDQLTLQDGERVVAAFAEVPDTGFRIVSRQPSAVAEIAAQRQGRVALQAFGLSLLMVALIAGAAWRTVVRPLRALIARQRRLAGLDHSSGAELDDLENALERLEGSLEDRDAMTKVFLGRYQVVDTLGAGAMGTVFRGFDPRLERYVALKTIKLGELAGLQRRRLTQRVIKEARTLARLSHPHVVGVYDVLAEGDAAFLAMELVEGVSLERYLKLHAPLPMDQVLALARALFQAIDAAHQQRVVHHDIKPANILLGVDGAIKVTDFGIAELVGEAMESDLIFGTPGYLPPEVYEGHGYRPTADLFAVGVVLYQATVGHHPFPGKTANEVMVATLVRPLVSLRKHRTDVPEAFDRLVLSLLARDESMRPADAKSVLETLTPIIPADITWQPLSFTSAEETIDDDRIHASLLPTRRVEPPDGPRRTAES